MSQFYHEMPLVMVAVACSAEAGPIHGRKGRGLPFVAGTDVRKEPQVRVGISQGLNVIISHSFVSDQQMGPGPVDLWDNILAGAMGFLI